MQNGWSLTFTDTDGKTRIGPWLLCDSHAEVVKILRWGNITDDDLDKHHYDLRRWGIAGGKLHLSSRQRQLLIVRGQDGPGTATSSKR